MLFWAGNFTIGRWADGHVPPVTLAFLRWTGAALLILPLAWPHMRRDWSVIKANLPLLLALGIAGTGLFNTLQYIALTGTTATSAAIINCSSPIMIAMLSMLVNQERVRLVQAIGIAMSLIGVMCVISRGELNAILGLELNWGDLVMLFAMGVWAVYTVLLKKLPKISIFAFAGVIYIIAAGLNAVLASLELAGGATVNWSPASIAAIAYTAIFPSFLAYLLYNRGVEILGPTRAGAFMHLVPLFTIILAVLFLGEQPGVHHALGLALILPGIWLASKT